MEAAQGVGLFMTESANKVMVICLDGGTFDIIQPMVERGELPHLASMMSGGIYEKLLSTVPPETGAAFVTFMTGVNPGMHGITRFIRKSSDPENSILLNSTHIASKTIWERLSEHGKKMILIGVPFTYPPTPINGVMISAKKLTPDGAHTIQTYPPDLMKVLTQYIKSRDVQKTAEERYVNLDEDDYYDFRLQKAFKLTEYVRYSAKFLMQEYQWDFMMVHINITDAVQHHFWKFMDTEHPNHDQSSPLRFKNAIFEAYRKADEIIGELSEQAGKDVSVIIMSDHGAGPISKRFHINNWLAKKGLLKLNKDSTQKTWQSIPISNLLRKLLNKAGLSKLSSWVPWLPLRIPLYRRRQKSFHELINWEETLAYGDNYGININMKGRETKGVVSPGDEYEKISALLVNELSLLTDTENSKRIVEQILRKEDIYNGPWIDEGTDIIPFLQKGYFIHPQLDGKIVFDGIPHLFPSGHHVHNLCSRKGILVIKGKGINNKSEGLKEPRILDLAPTILYMMGLPIPGEMEGRVLHEGFLPKHLEEHPVIIKKEKDNSFNKVERQEVVLSKEETEAIKDQLRDLGYL